MKRVLIALALILITSIAATAEVSNTQTMQEGNRMLFTYDLVGDESESEVSVSLKIDGKTYTGDELHLEGDYGKVKTGKGRKVYWNVLQDFPRGLTGEFEVDISAGGGAMEGMVFVKGGCFQMGCGSWTSNCESDEKPVHKVCLDDFYIGRHEVTQGEYKAVMGSNPSNFSGCGDSCPVESVTWHDARAYCEKAGKRLPTEAEWEYAARSGGKRERYAGSDSPDGVAWYDGNSGGKTHPVGQKQANGLGIYDMSGNVWEWVSDWYGGGDYYKNSPRKNPKGPGSGQYRVLRGGSWDDLGNLIRASYRRTGNRRSDDLGFRCAGTP